MPILPNRGRRPLTRQSATPPAGHLEELAPSGPATPDPVPAPPPTRTTAPDAARFGGRFPTAAAALVFASQVDDLGRGGTLEITYSPSTRTWWALAELPITTCRELVASARGEPYADIDGELLPDRG